jgi:hypothetical protein
MVERDQRRRLLPTAPVAAAFDQREGHGDASVVWFAHEQDYQRDHQRQRRHHDGDAEVGPHEFEGVADGERGEHVGRERRTAARDDSHIWKWMPFWTMILLAGRMAIPQELYEAADMDGATGLKRFTYVSFPLLANRYLVCTLLSTLFKAITDPSASHREVSSQPGPSMPKKAYSALLMRPHSPLSIQWIEMKAGSAGTAQGST